MLGDYSAEILNN